MVEQARKPMSVHRLERPRSNVKWKVKPKPYGGKRQALTQVELDRLFAALKRNNVKIVTGQGVTPNIGISG
jgi:hypothetical protein